MILVDFSLFLFDGPYYNSGKIQKIFFLPSGNSQIKSYSVKLLGLECSSNPQNFMKIVGAIFERMKIFYFLLCELPLILRADKKTGRRCFQRDYRYRHSR